MNKTILVVEFDEAVRRTVSTCLEKNGYHVIQAANSSSGLREMEKGGEIHLVITDNTMTYVGEGSAMALIIRQTWPNVPVILMSSNTPLQSPRTDVQLLPKPFTIQMLLETVSEALRSPAA